MDALREVDVPELPLSAFRPLIGPARATHLEVRAKESRDLLAGRTVWNVNSTASGGGVAEMLQVLVGYIRGAGVNTRWLVMEGDPPFFAITKRLHNGMHGVPGDGGPLGAGEAAHYAAVTEANATAMLDVLRPGDIVLLHDPQTAGMSRYLARAGVHLLWRCHIGADHDNAWTDRAWGFLRPHLAACDGYIFSRRAYVPSWIPEDRVAVIPPSIDPFSPKNQDLAPTASPSILARIGVIEGDPEGLATFTRRDGSYGLVEDRASIISDRAPLPPASRLVVQVSRWDRLKDMSGVMHGFASHVAGRVDADLALVGPSVEGVADDPEGAEVFAECIAARAGLHAAVRSRIHLVTLPMRDVDENAAMVNALQRAATVVVQKSLAEGFGLTVAESMWKGRPVVGSRVGGITDQIAPGTGVLLEDPTDLDAYGEALAGLLNRPGEMAALGERARDHVLNDFVGDRHLLQYADLMQKVVSPTRP